MTAQGLYLITFQGIAAIDNAEPHPATGGAQEGAQRRSWWRRVFGS
jgi:hypothetical protein